LERWQKEEEEKRERRETIETKIYNNQEQSDKLGRQQYFCTFRCQLS
jgi:hypothetical protein